MHNFSISFTEFYMYFFKRVWFDTRMKSSTYEFIQVWNVPWNFWNLLRMNSYTYEMFRETFLSCNKSSAYEIKNNAWVNANKDFLSRVRRSGNDFTSEEVSSENHCQIASRVTKNPYSRCGGLRPPPCSDFPLNYCACAPSKTLK